MKYDALIVGAGPFGCTLARCLLDAGKRVLVVDRRAHVGGNAHDEQHGGLTIHVYGAHIFHTNDDAVWQFVGRFSDFSTYRHYVMARSGERLYSLPFTLHTLHQLCHVRTPAEAAELLRGLLPATDGSLESWARSQLPGRVFETLVRGYTEKQWGRGCSELPASILRRIPIRLDFDSRYFTDRHQGLPVDGYDALFRRMLGRAAVELQVDYLADRHYLDRVAYTTVFSGPIDAFFGYIHGPLEYRGLRHETRWFTGSYQGCPVMNHPDPAVPYIRTYEWKHFRDPSMERTAVTFEYPGGDEPSYPVRTPDNLARLVRYQEMAAQMPRHRFGGRLGSYQYYNMDQVMAQAMKRAEELI